MLPLEITDFLTLKSNQDTSVRPSVRDSTDGIPVLFRSDHVPSKAPSHSTLLFLSTLFPYPQIPHLFVKIK